MEDGQKYSLGYQNIIGLRGKVSFIPLASDPTASKVTSKPYIILILAGGCQLS